MSKISLLLLKVHENVHVFPHKMDYSEPKIYTGGVDITNWGKLSKFERNSALKKDWHVYYSFRNPKTGKLKRQPNIKGGANRFKDKPSRYHILKQLQKALLLILQEGFNPYGNNTSLADYLMQRLDGNGEKVKNVPSYLIPSMPSLNTTIKEAFTLGLDLKKKMMNVTSFTKYNSRIKRFLKWLGKEGIKETDDLNIIDRKLVIQYLNKVLQDTSPRNRNNARTDLSSFFQVLEDNDLIKENFVKKVNVLKAVPQRNKSFTPEMLDKIDAYLMEKDPLLRLYIQFIAFNFLRPIEVCRLRIGDVDIMDKKLYVKAKNQPVKTKIIPEILLDELPDLSSMPRTNSLFNINGLGGQWNTTETNKRDYFSKRFKKVKDEFELNENYGLYSFRHTYITKLYRKLVENSTPFEAKSKLKLITGHSTMKALEQYLREIDAELPNDYSKLLK